MIKSKENHIYENIKTFEIIIKFFNLCTKVIIVQNMQVYINTVFLC